MNNFNMLKSSYLRVLLVLLVMLMPRLALASTDVDSVEGAMCKAYAIFDGPLGKTFAIFAIVALGVGFFMGKVSWATAIAIALGIGAVFGAPALVGALTGGTKGCVRGGNVDGAVKP